MLEDILRRFVFHRTLDWQSAREAWAMLEEDQEMFVEDYAGP